jgi:hypothetical protein
MGLPNELENEVVRASIRRTPTMIVALACIKSPAVIVYLSSSSLPPVLLPQPLLLIYLLFSSFFK